MSRVFHVIDSIKGGCGKTTFAIMLTEYLEKQFEEEFGGNRHACLLDMDFLGTGMVDLFFKDKEKEDFLEKNIYITDKIRNFHVEDKQYICPFEIYGETLYVGFGDPDFRTKEKFRCNPKYNYASTIGYGIFRSGIKNILEPGALEEQLSGEVGAIVLDTSPGMDAYSETVKENIFDRSHSSFLLSEDRRNYYLMVGMDFSHLSSAKSYLADFLKGEDRKIADHIFIVFDDLLQVLIKNPIEKEIVQYNARISEFQEILKDVSEELLSRIHFLVLNPFYAYSKALYELKTFSELSETDMSHGDKFFLEIPFRFMAEKEEGEYIIKEELKTGEMLLKWLK